VPGGDTVVSGREGNRAMGRAMTRKCMPDIVGGLCLFVASLAYLLFTLYSYELGTARRMGPGFYPAALGIATMVVAAIVILDGFRKLGEWPDIEWRPAIWVSVSIVACIVGLSRLGMVPAAFLTVGLAAIADTESRPLGTVVLAGAIATLSWLIFIVGFGMSIHSFRMPF